MFCPLRKSITDDFPFAVAGEVGGAESVSECLDHLGVTRIGHGARSIEDPKLVDRLVHDDIVLEVCPVSNIALAVFSGYQQHPLRKLMDAGVRVTLNSDDPPFFRTSLEDEYRVAEEQFGFNKEMLVQCTRTALEAAFVDEQTRTELMNRLDNSF